MPGVGERPQVNPQVQAVVDMMTQEISKGVLRLFAQYFPTGIANPVTPVVVKRQTPSGPVMQHTHFAQLVAELIDEMKKTNEGTQRLAELIDEELEEVTRKRRR